MLVRKNILNDEFSLAPKTMLINIETTGFSAKYASIYMVGFIYYHAKKAHYILEQWLCEKASDEYQLLYQLNQKLLNYPNLIHYNGHLFDMPFILTRMNFYQLTLNPYRETDFLILLRPFKSALSLKNLQLPTVATSFGYTKKITLNNKKLIALYHDYLTGQTSLSLKPLLKHNKESLNQLMTLTGHLALFHFIQKLKNMAVPILLSASYLEEDSYHCHFNLNLALPCSFTLHHPLFSLELHPTAGHLILPTQKKTFKYFHSNVKAYDYLPKEDYAIHKSIGKYLPKNQRLPATKATCYSKKQDYFLPGYKHMKLPLYSYKPDYKSGLIYFSLEELIEKSYLENYISKLLQLI